MNRLFIALLLISLLIVGCGTGTGSGGQDKSKDSSATTAKEVLSFRGIEIGTPIENFINKYPECKTEKGPWSITVHVGTSCKFKRGINLNNDFSKYFNEWSFIPEPVEGFDDMVGIGVMDGKIELLYTTFGTSKIEQVLLLMKEKFGQTNNLMETKKKAPFEEKYYSAITIIWDLPDGARVTLATDSPNSGSVLIVSSKAMKSTPKL